MQHDLVVGLHWIEPLPVAQQFWQASPFLPQKLPAVPALQVPVGVSQQPVQVLVGHCPPQPSASYWHFSVQFGVQHALL